MSSAELTGEAGAYDEHISDPAKPVPFIDWIEVGLTANYMVTDQRFASRCSDVLVYQTEILERELRLAGPIEVDLRLSTTGTDSDWIVKIIDDYPDDYLDPTENSTKICIGGGQRLIRGDVMRGKFHDSLEQPEPFHLGEPTRIRVKLLDICNAFRPGHRLMIQSQSTLFPLVDRSPQTFVDIHKAQAVDFQKATQRVYLSGPDASKVVVRVISE